ncbi:MAG: FG-GAP repeat domain-containing protein [Acidobacteriota bacterium]
MLRSVAVLAVLAGCHGAVTLEVATDRPIPAGLDAICVGVADTAARGGQFGKAYRLEGKLAMLPQTLRVDPGGASSATAWVRGDRGGVAVARAEATLAFDGDVTLALDTCAHGPAADPHPVGSAVGPASALVAASEGPGGVVVLAIAASGTAQLDAKGGALVAGAAPALPPGNPVAIATGDLDGDCDDDAIVATDGAPPAIWIRDHATFLDTGMTIGSAAVAAIALGDVDRDGDLDVILGRGGTLELWRNDGGGTFTLDKAALSAGGKLTAISALALGDLDGDGNPELVVGQANAPLAAWLGDPGGTGSFVASAAIVPAVTLAVTRFALADADGDYDPDLGIAVAGAGLRLLIDRDGRLEDQSFVREPQPAPMASGVAFADWNDGCPPDAVIAAMAGAPTWRGQDTGAFAAETTTAPPASDVVFADIDDDGKLDALFATPEGVQWLAR